ncbi:DUF4177 domain-containing protein [Niallia sp.]|uniref:DUF4177 domain-containing protein n=1 Tax=Niallia sp. TaxID=2837523 RepID=UPI00289AB073|nr:DUF4177 domain-containing protein [Niallia sp.]
MYEYQFVSIPVGGFSGKPKKDYQAIVHEYAKAGWRLHSVLTPPFGNGGMAITMELIFEKEQKEEGESLISPLD